MGMTIAEKIIALAAGVPEVKAGDIHTVTLDRMMSNDGTTHLTVDMYNNKLKHPHIADAKKMVFIVDHNVPADSPKTAASQKKMRDFARENNIDFWEGKGVCHQIMMENHVCPGELIFGADSHTCAYGALGAFGTGVGCTDYLYAMVTGKSWVLVPETLRFNLTGKLPEGVYARDLILTIIGKIGANGANYKAMEFAGEGLKTLTMSDRIAIINQGVLEQIDTPINIYQHPKTKFVAGFIGESNILDAIVLEDHDHKAVIGMEVGRGTVEDPDDSLAVNDPVSVSVRPENMLFSETPIEGFNLKGVVKEHIYVGNIIKMMITLNDGTEIKVNRFRSEDLADIGKMVYLYWELDKGVVIKEKHLVNTDAVRDIEGGVADDEDE